MEAPESWGWLYPQCVVAGSIASRLTQFDPGKPKQTREIQKKAPLGLYYDVQGAQFKNGKYSNLDQNFITGLWSYRDVQLNYDIESLRNFKRIILEIVWSILLKDHKLPVTLSYYTSHNLSI